MTSADLPREAAALLGSGGTSQPRALSQLLDLAIGQVTGCSGASATVWRDAEPVLSAASLPELSELGELERTQGRGPSIDALRDGVPVSSEDALAEDRWPEYARAALARGVRCWLTLPHQSGPVTMTLSLFAARPGALSAEDLSLAQILAAFGGAALGKASDFGDAQRTEMQLREAAESRMVVDQAKGILMNALGCNAAEALDRMRRISQDRGMKVTDVATRIVESPDFTRK
ncbi:MAG TPA: GAF and ANTAR domain-containing protein [Streptosporangiaceae bacterium]|jgi:hypothetical protein|nr:GAF and ANTAR domain-containing protein [Streptosporangiaceae bacterium]